MRKTVVIYFVVIYFILNLCLLLVALSTDTKEADIASDENVANFSNSSSESNISNIQPDILTSSNLEPSIADRNVAESENSNTKDELEAESVENLNTRAGNDMTVMLTSENTLTESNSLPDISMLMTSDHEEMESKLSAQKEDIPLDSSNMVNVTQPTEIPKVLIEKIPTTDATTEKNISDGASEDIPSFSEWAQKRLEEVEKSEQINSSTKGPPVNGKGQNAKLHWKNYASLDCGAKVVGANQETVSPGAILSPSSDEYKLNPCTSRIWFVVELCEAIQIKRIDLANYELFSSSPKDFTVSVSDRYPTRDWSFVGKFEAKDERDIQNFELDTHLFGKYVKVEVKSHYGSEHYCPISLFRAYGTSVFEVLQKEDPANINRVEEDDDDGEDDSLAPSDDPQKNLFTSATDAVMNIVKRAAGVLGNKVNNETKNVRNISAAMEKVSCCSPRHLIVCNNCNESLFGQIYELISCKSGVIKNLVSIPLIHRKLMTSFTCQTYGSDLRNYASDKCSYIDNLELFFPIRYIIAMCNEVAVRESQAILNVTQQYLNVTKELSKDKIVNMDVKSPEVSERSNNTFIDNLLKADNKTNNVSSGELEDVSYTAQIKPTKAINPDPNAVETERVSSMEEKEILTFDTVIEKAEVTSSLTDSTTGNASASTISASVENNLNEISDNLEDHIDHIISELNSESQSVSASAGTTAATNSPQAPKESIFLRLSNRIKALERNMSLSSQYLEELSKRYKKQVEEMQHLFEKTITTLREEGQKKDETFKQLEDRLNNLTTTIESLVAERKFVQSLLYLVIPLLLVYYGIQFFCGKSSSNARSENEKTAGVLRRRSVDVIANKPQEKRKRRPSDQVLKIVRHASLDEEEKSKRPRKRKKGRVVRSSSAGSVSKNRKNVEAKTVSDWVEENHQAVEDIPFALEESDHSTLEGYSLPNHLNKTESPKVDSSQCFSEIRDREKRKSTDEYSTRSSSNSTSTVVSCSDYAKKEKKGFKRLFKIKKVF